MTQLDPMLVEASDLPAAVDDSTVISCHILDVSTSERFSSEVSK